MRFTKMQSADSPVSSPEVECYEECVVAEEEVSAKKTPADRASPVPRVKKDSGRVTKKSEFSDTKN